MKFNAVFLLLITFFVGLTGCTKEDKGHAPESANVRFDPKADDVLLKEGTLTAVEGIDATGVIKLYGNPERKVLRFENFMVDNAPDLSVYLARSKDDVGDSYRVGDLIAASGNFNYTFGTTINTTDYTWVMVYSDKNNSLMCFGLLQ